MSVKKVAFWGVAAVIGIGAMSSASGSDSDNETYADRVVSQQTEKAKKAKAAPKPQEPQLTSGQEQALASAEDYLDYSAFSHSGLAEQLTFEGFSKKDAEFAANNVGANWKEQAAASAEDYLSYSSFSKSGLIEQLEFEGYTHAEAVYGANQAY